MSPRIGGIAALCLYIGTIFAANWTVQHYGVVDVGFGYQAPWAAFYVGLGLTLRDLVQRWLGREAVILAILAGAALSYTVAPSFAVASGVAFLVSEMADLAVYTPLARRNWLGAVLLSNTVGLVLDSVIFLWIAFGDLTYLPGQLIAKGAVTLAAVALLGVTWRRPAWSAG